VVATNHLDELAAPEPRLDLGGKRAS
jgi:hypothetical protein